MSALASGNFAVSLLTHFPTQIGKPMYYMETALGQYARLSPLQVEKLLPVKQMLILLMKMTNMITINNMIVLLILANLGRCGVVPQ